MEEKKAFEILDILSTKDTNDIKKAYRTKLVQVNPEDDPVGFKLLREAYEEAMRLANLQEEEPTPDTPIDTWIKKVDEVYKRISTRINLDCWRELFGEDICINIDTCNEARDAFLAYLMDHYRLPAEFWKLIEERFQLVSSKQELYDKYPVNFVDYITEDPENKAWMDFTLFEGDDEEAIDGFIEDYLALRRINDYNQYESAEELLEKFKQSELWHPYLEAEKMRFFVAQKRDEEAKEAAERLRNRKSNDSYVKYYLAEYYFAYGNLEAGYELCKEILEIYPDHYGAKIFLSDYYLKKEDYSAAKEIYLDLMENNYNQQLQEGLEKANEGFIAKYKQQLLSEPDNQVVKLDLAWCYYQNHLYEESKTLAESLVVEDEIYYDYYNLLSRLYSNLEEYKKAKPCIEKWLAEILKTKEDDPEKGRVRYNRLGLAYYLLARCYYNPSENKKDNEKEIDKLFQNLDLAIEVEKNKGSLLSYLVFKAQVLLEKNEDKRCVDVCDEIINLEQSYYPAYVLRQEAYFNLRMAQEVIDDYHSAIQIYPDHARPYLFAIKVYQAYKQFEDADQVIAKAKEAGAESKELCFLELKNRRRQTNGNEEREQIAKELGDLFISAQQEAGDLKEINELLHEQALCYYDMDENELALNTINKRLAIQRDSDSLRLKADILYHLKRYNDSIILYIELLRETPDFAHVHYMMGLSYKALGDMGKAMDSYMKAIQYDSEHPYVCDEIAELYKSAFAEKHRESDYASAVKYAKRQVEINPNDYYYVSLGLIYLDSYDMENAIKAFEEAIKCNEANPYPYNNMGYAYKVLGQYDNAHKYYQMSIDRIGDKDLLPYWNIATCYRNTRQYDNALEVYDSIAADREAQVWARRKQLEVYKQMGAWEQALEQVKKLIALDNTFEPLIEYAEIYAYMGNQDQALEFLKKSVKAYKAKSKPYIKMGNYLLWVAKNKRKALKYYKKAYKVAQKSDSEGQDEALRSIIHAYRALGKEKKGILYVKKIEELYRQRYGNVKEEINSPENRKVRLYYMAVWNYNTGQYPKAQHYMERMKNTLNCAHCTYGTCYEYLVLEGMMLEWKQDYRGALEKYQKGYEIASEDMYLLHKIEELKEKL